MRGVDHLLRCLSTDGLVLLERRLRRVAPNFMLAVIVAIRFELLRRYLEEGDDGAASARRAPRHQAVEHDAAVDDARVNARGGAA